MEINTIFANDLDFGIGIDNKLPWNLPKELSYFKTITNKSIVIMGANTMLSLPKLLPNRLNVVFTTNPKTIQLLKDRFEDFKNILIISSAKEFLDQLKQAKEYKGYTKAFIIGGKIVIEQFIDYSTYIYQTEIQSHFKCDCFLNIDLSGYKLISQSLEKENIMYIKKVWKRK